MTESLYFSGLEPCVERLINDISSNLISAIQKNGQTTLAVSGGRTPEHIFPKLSRLDLPWEKVSITLADERWVDPKHPDSNEGLVRRLLLQNAAAAARFVGLKTNWATPFEGHNECETSLSNLSWPIDALFLGMGEDGHIASLFPDAKNWQNVPGRTLAVEGSNNRQPRMSLSPQALLDSRHIYLVIKGVEKRTTLESAQHAGPMQDLPVRLVLHQDKVPVTIYIVD